MKKQLLLTVAICLVFTAINFSFRAGAQSETILNYSSVSNDVLTIGDADNYLSIDMNTGYVEIQGTQLWVKGQNSDMQTVYIDGRISKVGARQAGTGLLTVDGEVGEITADYTLITEELVVAP